MWTFSKHFITFFATSSKFHIKEFNLFFQFLSRAPVPSRDQERIASALELRMKDADYETDTLRDHHERNRGIMSQKMSDMSKLQNTLTNQAKVILF